MEFVAQIVPDKVTMRTLYRSGAFGNRPDCWSLDEYAATTTDAPVVLMYNGNPGVKLPHYTEHMDRTEILRTAEHWIQLGCDRSRITISSSMQTGDASVVIQGEVMRSESYVSVTYTRVNDYMRPALAKNTLHAAGLLAVLMLRQAMDAISWETLQDIWDRYPDSVVEFATFDRGVGCLRHNTIFWECRNY